MITVFSQFHCTCSIPVSPPCSGSNRQKETDRQSPFFSRRISVHRLESLFRQLSTPFFPVSIVVSVVLSNRTVKHRLIITSFSLVTIVVTTHCSDDPLVLFEVEAGKTSRLPSRCPVSSLLSTLLLDLVGRLYACKTSPLSLSLILEKCLWVPALVEISGDPPATGHRGHGGSGRRWGYMAVLGRIGYSHMPLLLLPVVKYRF